MSTSLQPKDYAAIFHSDQFLPPFPSQFFITEQLGTTGYHVILEKAHILKMCHVECLVQKINILLLNPTEENQSNELK